MKPAISYYRVSTKRQGKSGLGLEGQRAEVDEYAARNNLRPIASYIEVETGKSADRPRLKHAICHAKRAGAVLLVAKLDRLARNVRFTAELMDSNVDFLCCDNPNANRLTIHILAAIAEHEAEQISQRTKAALQAYKKRGGLLGAARPECRNLTPQDMKIGRQIAAARKRQRAIDEYKDLEQEINKLRHDQVSLREICRALNRQGHTTRSGSPWTSGTLCRVCKRLGI